MNQEYLKLKSAEADINQARERRAKATDKFNQILKENRERYDAFYKHMAIFLGGSIVASLTFLGYLRGFQGGSPQILWLLILSWGLLFISLLIASSNWILSTRIQLTINNNWEKVPLSTFDKPYLLTFSLPHRGEGIQRDSSLCSE